MEEGEFTTLKRAILTVIGVLIVAAVLGSLYAWYELQVATRPATDLTGASAGTSSGSLETNQQVVEKNLQNAPTPIPPSSAVPPPTFEQSKASVEQTLNKPAPSSAPSQKTQEANQKAVEAALNGTSN